MKVAAYDSEVSDLWCQSQGLMIVEIVCQDIQQSVD